MHNMLANIYAFVKVCGICQWMKIKSLKHSFSWIIHIWSNLQFCTFIYLYFQYFHISFPSLMLPSHDPVNFTPAHNHKLTMPKAAKATLCCNPPNVTWTLCTCHLALHNTYHPFITCILWVLHMPEQNLLAQLWKAHCLPVSIQVT